MKPALPSLVSKTAYADAVLTADLDPEARKQIIRLRDQWAADEEIVTRRPGVCKRLDCKPTHGRDLERSGQIDSFLAGTVRLIHVSSIYEHLIRQILATFPLGEPPRKAPGAPNAAIARKAIVRSGPAPAHVPERATSSSPAERAKKRALERELAAVAPSKKRVLERERAAAPSIKRGRGQAKKQTQPSALPAE